MSVQDAINRIRDFAAERKLKPSTMARQAGLHPNALRHMHAPDWSPRADTLRKLDHLIESIK